MSSSTVPPPNQGTASTTDQTAPSSSSNPPHQPLPLPEPPAAGQDGAQQLAVNGDGIRLDHMGPLVVHQDGTMSRIGNWAEMSEIERENTLRVLGKRNQLRLKKLREEKQAEEKEGGGNSGSAPAPSAAATSAEGEEVGKQ